MDIDSRKNDGERQSSFKAFCKTSVGPLGKSDVGEFYLDSATNIYISARCTCTFFCGSFSFFTTGRV
jgi:hypothetical protein